MEAGAKASTPVADAATVSIAERRASEDSQPPAGASGWEHDDVEVVGDEAAVAIDVGWTISSTFTQGVQVFATAVIGIGSGIKSAATGIRAALDNDQRVAGAVESRFGVFTSTIFIGGGGIIIARGYIGASGDFGIVAHPVAIDVVWTISTAFTQGIEVVATAIVCIGVGVKCAAAGIQAAIDHHRDVAVAIEIGGRVAAIAGVVSGRGVIVAGLGIGAPWNFSIVTHAIGVSIARTISTADPNGVQVFATVVVCVGCRIVRATRGVHASFDHNQWVSIAIQIGFWIEASAVVIGSSGFKIAGREVGTSGNLSVVANAITVDVVGTITTAIAQGIQVSAAAIVSVGIGTGVVCAAGLVQAALNHHRDVAIAVIIGRRIAAIPGIICGGAIKVAGVFICAPRNFRIVANAIGIQIIRTITATVAQGIQVLATAVICICLSIICAAASVGATRHIRNDDVLVFIANAIAIIIYARFYAIAVNTEFMELIPAEISPVVSEHISI